MIARRLSVLAVLALGLAGSGCGPAHRVVWLPDSSGFVYSPNGPKGTGDAALIHYDLKQKTARGLKYVPSQSMIMPGISPDRKQIALVRAQKNRNQRVTAQVILMDLDTGSIHESSPGTLGVLKGETERVPSCVLALTEWSPKRDHLLISSVPPLFDDDDSGIADLVAYDLKTDTLMPLRGLASTFFDRPLNGSIAGDGSGFLAFSVEEWKKSQKGESEDAKITYAALLKTLVFVDWSGHRHPFKMSDETRDASTQGLVDHGSDPLGAWWYKLDSNLQGSWEGPVAVLPLSRGVVRIDCAQHTIGFRQDARVSDDFDRGKREKVTMSRQLAHGEVVVEGIDVGQRQRKDTATSIAGPTRIDLWMPKKRTRRTLVESALWVILAPAPDSRKLAIRYGLDANDERILVIDDQGVALADFAIERSVANLSVESTQGGQSGTERASNGAEEAELARRAQAARNKAAAERYARALAADPWLRDDLEAVDRYLAACDDLQTGCGDGPPAGEAERARLRRRALDSLQANLALRRRQLESGTAENRVKVQQHLELWKVDRGLAGIRGPESLAKLPATEQADWRAFWAEAEALERKVQATGR